MSDCTGDGGTSITSVFRDSPTVTLLESNVTAPIPANALPSSVAPETIVMEAYATMVPLNAECDPSVAELPTCQKTLPAVAPPLRITRALPFTVSADPTWKIQTAFGLPLAFRVRSPVIASEEWDLYRPGSRVRPTKSAASTLIGAVVRPAASLNATSKEACACCAT